MSGSVEMPVSPLGPRRRQYQSFMCSAPLLRNSARGRRLGPNGGPADDGGKAELTMSRAYDPKTNDWRALRPMPTARQGLGAATVSKMYVIVGGPTPGGSASAVNEIFVP
jgi:hypothetical protein